MNSKNKILIFFLIVIVYFSIMVLFFIGFIKFPFVSPSITNPSKIDTTRIVGYFNPFNLKIIGTNIINFNNGRILQVNLRENYLSIRDETIIYYYHKGWEYSIKTNNISFKKDSVIVYYKSIRSNTYLEIYIPNKYPVSNLKNLFNQNYNIYSYPFTYSQMSGVLTSLETPLTPYIKSTSFQFFKNNLNNVNNFQNNTPIEEITGVSILDSSSQLTINSLLNEYISRFNSWGYIPFTVYGAIIDNNTIYYLKYNLGGASIEVSVKPKNGYSLVYYNAKVSASSTNNNLFMFVRLGWNRVFN